VVEDWERRGPWWTARRAWMAGLRGGATHHLVLQDDVIPCRDFLEGAKAALAAVPDQPVSFYANREVVTRIRARNDSAWAVIPDACWGQGLCLPVDQIGHFLRWSDEHIEPDYPHDDDRFVLYFLSLGRFVWYTMPSLLDHAGAGRSLMGHAGRVPQRARWFLGEEESALSIDWSRCVVATPDPRAAFRAYLRRWKRGLRRAPRGPA